MTLLTILSAPKPFTDPHVAVIQRNAIRSWLILGDQVDVLLLGEEDGLAENARDLGAVHIPAVERNRYGTPLIRSLFEIGRNASGSPLLLFVNTDILLQPHLVMAASRVAEKVDRFLIVGQRYDLAVSEQLDFSPAWDERLSERCRLQGRLHPRGGSDYFIFPRDCYLDVPDLAVGRAGWDNWMIYEARQQSWPTIDATADIQVIHQDHDYNHLPGGQAHYRLPESWENVQLAGGERRIFTLLDCTHRLVNGEVLPAALSWEKIWREVEIFPLVRLHSGRLAEVFHALFHPLKAYRQCRKKMME